MTASDLLLGVAGSLGFVFLTFLGSRMLPGRVVTASVEEAGAPKRYKLNGFALFALIAALSGVLAWSGWWSPASILRYFQPLFLAANGLALVVGLLVLLKGRRGSAGSPQSPSAILRDFLEGAELNPEWKGVDLKMFSYRPSLIALGLINVSFAFFEQETYGSVSGRMWLYQIFWFLYLANYFQFEHGMLFTWDVIAERFGFLLVWGNYVLVPFFYSLPGWYLVRNREPLGAGEAAALVSLYVFGFWLFRGANEQKHRFKTNPRAQIWGQPAQTIGGRLLVSGFWGIGRKLNYTGELCLYSAWTLLCGFGSLVPYLPLLWLALLLAHRAWRDEQRCRRKYGDLWAEYRRRVRFRMLPFLY